MKNVAPATILLCLSLTARAQVYVYQASLQDSAVLMPSVVPHPTTVPSSGSGIVFAQLNETDCSLSVVGFFGGIDFQYSNCILAQRDDSGAYVGTILNLRVEQFSKSSGLISGSRSGLTATEKSDLKRLLDSSKIYVNLVSNQHSQAGVIGYFAPPVPEPSVWGLAVGLTLIGFGFYHRHALRR